MLLLPFIISLIRFGGTARSRDSWFMLIFIGSMKSSRKISPGVMGSRKSLLEAVSKPHLRPNGRVAARFKMLTYIEICFAFSSACALPLNLIWGFETASTHFFTSMIINNSDIESADALIVRKEHCRRTAFIIGFQPERTISVRHCAKRNSDFLIWDCLARKECDKDFPC